MSAFDTNEVTKPLTCSSGQLTLKGTVTEVNKQIAHLSISPSEKKSCRQCHNKGGCQSLSLYQLFFANHPITVPNKHYAIGQSLIIHFPSAMIQQSVALLLGLPLVGFISGILMGAVHHELTGFAAGLVLGIAAYFMSRQLVKKRLLNKIQMTNDSCKLSSPRND